MRYVQETHLGPPSERDLDDFAASEIGHVLPLQVEGRLRLADVAQIPQPARRRESTSGSNRG